MQEEKSDTVGYYFYIIYIKVKRNRVILQPKFRLNSEIIPLSSTFFPTRKVDYIFVIRRNVNRIFMITCRKKANDR